MQKRLVYFFVFNGFSDWEISYVMPELNKSPLYEIKTFSLDGQPVYSMGSLKILPDLAIADVEMENLAMLVLPGGDAWEEEKLREVSPLVEQVHQSNIPIAAICGATILLAEMGLLNQIEHTSNAKEYLKAIVPGYKGAIYYLDQRTVSDKNIITATGIAPIEFAREIFRELNLYEDAAIEKWFQLFRNGVWIE
mgnify:CR=1 FL=1